MIIPKNPRVGRAEALKALQLWRSKLPELAALAHAAAVQREHRTQLPVQMLGKGSYLQGGRLFNRNAAQRLADRAARLHNETHGDVLIGMVTKYRTHYSITFSYLWMGDRFN